MPAFRKNLGRITLLAVCVLLSALPTRAGAVGFGLRVSADRDRIPADGRSQVAITVEVTDAYGAPVPDGTRVYLATSLGRIVSPVQTVGGLAQSVLTAPNTPGVAIVSAMAGASQGSLQIEFLPRPGGRKPAARILELTAKEISYSADQRVFIATDNAKIESEDLTISADGLQYDMDRNVVCAQGNVSLRSGPRLASGDAMRFDLLEMKGEILRLGDKVTRVLVEGEDLEEKPANDGDASLWGPLDTGETSTWVKAKRAIIDPGKKVILDHATFYVNDTPVMSLPRHVIDPSLGAAVFGRTLSYSSSSGVSVDFPWYYRASANRVGSLHITRNQAVDGFSDEIGWALGIREEYLRGEDVSGAFTLDDLTDPRRGVHWEHSQPIGRMGRLRLQADAADYEDEDSRFRSGNLNYSRQLGGGELSLILSRMGYAGSEQSHSDLSYRFADMKPARGITMVPALHLRHSAAENSSQDVLVNTETGEPLTLEDTGAHRSTSVGLDLAVRSAAMRLTPRTQLESSLTTGYFKTLSGGGQTSLGFRLSLDQNFGASDRATLTYTYSGNPDAGDATLFSAPRHMLNLTSAFRALGCSARMSASQELGGSRRYGSLNLVRPLPFGRDSKGRTLWDLRLTHFFTRVDQLSAVHTRIKLGRKLGRYRASLCYSPQGAGDFDSRPWISAYGYGYTYAGGRKFWLELTAAAD